MKDFLSLNPKECAEVYPQIIENGNRHIHSAKLLGKHEEYPHAIAHLILGAEELIKGVFLGLESKGIIYNKLKNYKKLYFDHKTRHNILKDFYTYWIPLKTIIGLFTKKKGTLFQKLLLSGIELVVGASLATTNYSWWDKADALKQKCLYVDFKDLAISPSELGKSDFDQALLHVNSLHEDLNDFINFLESLNEVEMEKFKETLNSEDFTHVLGKVFEKKKTKA